MNNLQRSGQGRLKPQHLRYGTKGELSRTPTLRHQAQGSENPRRATPGERAALGGLEIPTPNLQGSPLFITYWKPEGIGAQMMLPT